MRKMMAKSGEPLLKHLEFKVFHPKNEKFQRFVLRAEAGKGFGRVAIEEQLHHIADQIEKRWPRESYKLVPTGIGRFNFVWAGSINDNESTHLGEESLGEAQ